MSQSQGNQKAKKSNGVLKEEYVEEKMKKFGNLDYANKKQRVEKLLHIVKERVSFAKGVLYYISSNESVSEKFLIVMYKILMTSSFISKERKSIEKREQIKKKKNEMNRLEEEYAKIYEQEQKEAEKILEKIDDI